MAFPAQLKLQYPEIDTRTFNASNEGNWTSKCAFPPYSEVETSVDVLDVFSAPQEAISETGQRSERTSIFRTQLDHGKLVEHIESKTNPALRILFLRTASQVLDPNELRHSSHSSVEALSTDTIQYLIERLCVSPVFIATITTDPWVLKSGSGFFRKRDNIGNFWVDGFYRFSCGFKINQLSSNVWFCHRRLHTSQQASTYIIRNCPEFIKSNILATASKASSLAKLLLRPMAVDAFVAEGSAHAWSEEFLSFRAKLVEHEHRDREKLRSKVNANIQELHTLSQDFNILKEDLQELIERLQYLLRLHNTVDPNDILKAPSRWGAPPLDQDPDVYPPGALPGDDRVVFTTTYDSIEYLLSRVIIWKRWSQNYTDRTSILINELFNLASQWDNQTNLHIADYTSKIATISQRDSSSMIAMAAVTMVFLPGAFVSALFSMVFFDTQVDSSGQLTVTASPQLWLFPAITAPLTILIFVLWHCLRVKHNRKQAAVTSGNGGSVPDASIVAPSVNIDLLLPHRNSSSVGGRAFVWPSHDPDSNVTDKTGEPILGNPRFKGFDYGYTPAQLARSRPLHAKPV
ncbi:hypothetical protein FA15DRAFT_666364, partial [Coprinopsis marcescibilis]